MAADVNQTFSAPGVSDIMDFDFVPWGNAYFAAVTGNTTYVSSQANLAVAMY